MCAERAGYSTWARAVGVPHIVARFDSNGETGLNEVVHGVCRVGAGLELAAGGAVRRVLLVLLEQAMEKAEVALIRVQAGARWRGAEVGGERRLQVHHVRVRHGAVFTAVIVDRDRAGFVGLSAIHAGDEEREDHLESRKSEPAVGGAPVEAAGTQVVC